MSSCPDWERTFEGAWHPWRSSATWFPPPRGVVRTHLHGRHNGLHVTCTRVPAAGRTGPDLAPAAARKLRGVVEARAAGISKVRDRAGVRCTCWFGGVLNRSLLQSGSSTDIGFAILMCRAAVANFMNALRGGGASQPVQVVRVAFYWHGSPVLACRHEDEESGRFTVA